MSEPILERLSQFTPDTGGLVRDDLLFAAGRASARPNRAWISLATALACTQLLALVVLGPRATPSGGEWTLPVVGSHPPLAARQRSTAKAPADAGVWTVRHGLDDFEIADRPAGAVTLIDSGPPLRAFGPPPSSVLN